MTLRIEQDHEYNGNDHWQWRAWIEGKAGELQKVQRVKWFLHPSFTPSVIVSREAATKFRLEASGWGTFLLRAELRLIDGSEVTLRQHLKLAYPDDDAAGASGKTSPRQEEPAAAPARSAAPRKVFLSYGSEDRGRALALRRTLEALGILVVDDSQISAGSPVELATLDLMSGADATIAYVASDLPSAFVVQEVNASIKAGKPTLVISNEKLDPIFGLDTTVPVRQLDTSDQSGIAAALDALKL